MDETKYDLSEKDSDNDKRAKEIEKKYNKLYESIYTAEEKAKAGLAKDAEVTDEIKKKVAERMATEEHKALIDSEVTAKLAGKALNNERFLKRYADRDKKFIQKAFEWLKETVTALKKNGKDTEEVSEVANEMALMMDVLLQAPTVGESKSGMKYSLNVREVNGKSHIVDPYQISKDDVLKYLLMSFNRRLEDHTYFPVSSHTPDVLISTLRFANIYVTDKPMAMQAKKAKLSQETGSPQKKDGIIVRKHEMSAEEIIETIDKISNPEAIIQETNRIKKKKVNNEIIIEPAPDRFTVVVTLDSGKECVAVIEFDSEMSKNDIIYDGNGEEYHTTVTVFSPDVIRNGMPFDYIEYLLLDRNNRELDIKTESPKSDTAYGEHFATVSNKGLSNNSIPQKSDLSTSSEKKYDLADDGAPTAEQIAEWEKPITLQDVEVLRSIGRKSINAFTADEIKKAQKWAYKFYKELGTKSPFFRAWFGEWRAYDTSPAQLVNFNYGEYPELNHSDRIVFNADMNRSISIDGDTFGDSYHYANINGDMLHLENRK